MNWKIASLGIPIVLVYLGFLNAVEMVDRGKTFESNAKWKACLMDYAKGVIPSDARGNRFEVAGTPVWFSCDL